MFEELLDKALQNLEKGLPFVLYSKPNSDQLQAIYQADDRLNYVADFTETGFVFAPFNTISKSILIQSKAAFTAHIEYGAFELNDILENNSGETSEKSRYKAMISKALNEIGQGDLEKVVLSRKIEVPQTDTPLQIFQRILTNYRTAFRYIWYHPEVGIWVGATPEILLKTNGQQLFTMSLAGTQSSLEFEQAQWTAKELHEQQVVTDYILRALQTVALSVNEEEVETIKAGNLWHLRTKLSGTFAPNAFGKVVKAIHPTPAVCGIPLKAAEHFILENESYERTFYTGFLGELNFKNEVSRNKNRRNQENSAYRSLLKTSELFVNLRCMQVFDDKVQIYVGGGITKDSDPEREWEETVSKSSTMRSVLRHK